MPGMGRTVQTGNSLIVSSFHSALAHQLLVVLAVVAVCALAFNVVRTVQYRRLQQAGSSFPSSSRREAPEPPARRVLRIGFGCLWIFDGLLQLQSSMPLGLPSGAIQPGAATSPGMGPAPGERRGDRLVRPPDPSRGSRRVDPDRHRGLAVGGSPRTLVTAWGCGEPRLGPRGLGVRGGVRRNLRPRAHLAIRRTRCRPSLLRGRPSPRAARARLREAAARPHRPRNRGRIPHRDGAPPGLAGTRVLAGSRWHPLVDGAPDGGHSPAPPLVLVGAGLRRFRRRTRVVGEPLRGARTDRHRGAAAQWAPTSGAGGIDRVAGALCGRLGLRRGLRVLRRDRHRPELDAADGVALRRWLPGHLPASGGGRVRSHGSARGADAGTRRSRCGRRRGSGALVAAGHTPLPQPDGRWRSRRSRSC